MDNTNIQKALQAKLLEQHAILKSATADAESIRRPHCRDLWEIAEERERAVVIDHTLQNTQENIRKIENALHKVDADNYGLCEHCGDEISIDRLKIIPEVAFCQSCQSES